MKKTLLFFLGILFMATFVFAQSITFYGGSSFYQVEGPSTNIYDTNPGGWPLGGPGEYIVNTPDFSWFVDPGPYDISGDQNGNGPGSFILEDNSLPVQMSLFTAQQKGRSVLIEWVTESELDNLGFILERSLDKETWQKIASYETCNDFKGQGTTSTRTEYSFTDSDVTIGNSYYYKLSDLSTEGNVCSYRSTFVNLEALPQTTLMQKAYPNPFNPQTYIQYQLSKASNVKITVYDMLGHSVKTLFNGEQAEGCYQTYWNGTDQNGRHTASGTYLIQMETENTTEVQKVLYIK